MKRQVLLNRLSDKMSVNETIELSSYCPCCGVHLSPTLMYGVLVDYEDECENKVFLLNFCPECDECFISKHIYNDDECNYDFHSVAPITSCECNFSSRITELSPDFVKIYTEAFTADQLGFSNICGMGYRKALEFLIKDYIISQNSSLEEIVSTKMLGACINDHISDKRLKTLAKASAWLGNDETHYYRKHSDFNIEDLKIFVNAFVTFIDSELAYQDAQKLISKS